MCVVVHLVTPGFHVPCVVYLFRLLCRLYRHTYGLSLPYTGARWHVVTPGLHILCVVNLSLLYTRAWFTYLQRLLRVPLLQIKKKEEELPNLDLLIRTAQNKS